MAGFSDNNTACKYTTHRQRFQGFAGNLPKSPRKTTTIVFIIARSECLTKQVGAYYNKGGQNVTSFIHAAKRTPRRAAISPGSSIPFLFHTTLFCGDVGLRAPGRITADLPHRHPAIRYLFFYLSHFIVTPTNREESSIIIALIYSHFCDILK